ncbi:MAG: SDR family oxidoreductase, partial [Deltaproteobacteria bacterium]|nr:SDR family oxidoreductase [Deltaproteobacteria bacterium]
GIGSAVCKALAQDGLSVAVADFNGDAAVQLTDEIRKEGGESLAVETDVGDKAKVNSLVEKVIDRYGQVDFLINGAGIRTIHPILDMTEEEWDRVIEINLKGVFLCSQIVGAHMRSRNQGRIINIASGRGVVGGRGERGESHYAASKGGVIAFTKSAANELARHNILVNAIAPGRTDTSMARGAYTETEWEKVAALPPLMGGLTRKEEIVGLIRYLISDAACYVTGQL